MLAIGEIMRMAERQDAAMDSCQPQSCRLHLITFDDMISAKWHTPKVKETEVGNGLSNTIPRRLQDHLSSKAKLITRTMQMPYLEDKIY